MGLPGTSWGRAGAAGPSRPQTDTGDPSLVAGSPKGHARQALGTVASVCPRGQCQAGEGTATSQSGGTKGQEPPGSRWDQTTPGWILQRTGALGGQPRAPAASPGDPREDKALCHPSRVIGRGTARTSGTNIWEQRHGAGMCTPSQREQAEVPQAALGFRSSQKSHLGGENLSLLSGLSRTGFGTGFKGGMCQGHEILLGRG